MPAEVIGDMIGEIGVGRSGVEEEIQIGRTREN